MKQVAALVSTYSSDEFGICSALYELGGMVVMHDASGCNSTYTTHDEPRWYDMDSMIYISAISEMEAIMGDDDKLIGDITETAAELHPKFIAVVGAPIPYMIGTDFAAIAEILEHNTGVPCFGMEANGMCHYTKGVSMALEEIIDRFSKERDGRGRSSGDGGSASSVGRAGRPRVNIIGATPLDFSVNGSVESMREWLGQSGFEPGASIAMGCTLDDIVHAGDADLNLVVSYGGLAAARILEKRFGIPYVAGVPAGREFAEYLADKLREALASGKSSTGYMDVSAETGETGDGNGWIGAVGESVYQASVAAAAAMEQGVAIKVLCPLDTDDSLVRPCDMLTPEEDDIMQAVRADGCRGFMADPMYRPLCPEGVEFYELPHEAFSGRIYDSVNPNLINRQLAESLYDFRK